MISLLGWERSHFLEIDNEGAAKVKQQGFKPQYCGLFKRIDFSSPTI